MTEKQNAKVKKFFKDKRPDIMLYVMDVIRKMAAKREMMMLATLATTSRRSTVAPSRE